MMLRKMRLIVMAIVTMLFVQSCDDENSSSDTTARIQLKLVDAPGEYEAVIVNIEDVQYNNSEDEEGWRSFEGFTPTTVDLLTLTNGESLELTDEIIEAGTLKQIRLILGESGNEITVDGETSELSTPSSQQSGLKLNLDEVLNPGFSYAYIIDFDVDKSIVSAGNSGNYILKPVLRIEAEATSGSVSGIVKFDEDGEGGEEPVAIGGVVVEVYENDVYVTSIISSSEIETVGEFLIQGLGAGTYNLQINETEAFDAYDGSSIDNVVAGTGDVVDAGEIILTKTVVP